MGRSTNLTATSPPVYENIGSIYQKPKCSCLAESDDCSGKTGQESAPRVHTMLRLSLITAS